MAKGMSMRINTRLNVKGADHALHDTERELNECREVLLSPTAHPDEVERARARYSELCDIKDRTRKYLRAAGEYR